MKTFIVACVVALAALATADNLYDVDDHNWDYMLENPSKWNYARQCMLDEEPCDEWQQLKEGVVQRLKTNCGECTDKQRVKFDYVVKRLKEKYPEDFQKIIDHIAKQL